MNENLLDKEGKEKKEIKKRFLFFIFHHQVEIKK